MQIDVRFDGRLSTTAAEARAAEAAGFDAAWVAEAGNDPFLALAVAAEHTEHLELGTAVAIAFARNPMTLATTAYELNAFARGRMLLGVGSQVKAHVERRYSMPWSRPAARMREFVLAMRAIWAAWDTGEPLAFSGEFYTHTLMPPMFAAERSQFGAPRVLLAAVGPLMTRTAGEVADGLRVHGFTTERYLREVTVPQVESGLAAAGRTRDSFEISYPVMYATGLDERQLEMAKRGTRRQLAFYGSTPAYRDVLSLHGWEELHTDLNALSKRGEWEQMASLIDDDVLTTFAVVGDVDNVAAQITGRYGDIVDRISLHQPYDSPVDVDLVAPVMARLRVLAPRVDVSAPAAPSADSRRDRW